MVSTEMGAAKIIDGKAQAAGCDAYVTKPYSPRQLLAKIKEFLP